jgi:transcriptional regulator with XRE-family HTH domain
MTGRPEKPLDPSAGPVAKFAYSLRRLRKEVGVPSYRTLASRTYYSVAALSIAAGGTRFPSWPCVEAYIRACGVRDDDIVHWKRRWSAVDRHVRAERRAAKAKAKAKASKPSLEVAEVMQTMARLPVLEVRYVDADPADVVTLEEFLTALDQMRIEKGLSLRQVAERSRRTSLPGTEVSGGLSRSQLHEMLNGRAPLRKRHVLAYLLACGVPQDRAAVWLARLYQLHDQERRARAALAALSRSAESVTVTTTRTRTVTQAQQDPTEEPRLEEGRLEVSSQESEEVAALASRGKHRRPKSWTSLFHRAFTRTTDD